MLTCVLAALLVLPAPSGNGRERALDTVRLKDGETLEGYVLYEGSEALVLQVGNKRRELPKAELAEVRSVPRSLRMLLDQYANVDTSDPRQMLDLARFARARQLDGLAELFALRALVSAPDDTNAHEFLGHKRRGKDWSTDVGKRKVPYSKLADLHSEWNSAWEIRTPHYELRTDLELSTALDVAMDLELFYREFYERFGLEIELYEVTERMRTRVYSDGANFPSIGARAAYFDPADMTTYVNAERGYVRDLILHEASHQLLFATAVSPAHSAEARGCLPAWLDEGLACWFQAVQTGPPGRLTFEYRQRWHHYMTLHGTTENPYALARVLTFGADDYHASSRVDLKYAQAYTLVEFFMVGDFYRHRDSFHEILRRTYAGRCTSKDVEDALSLDAGEFEAAWIEFVRG